MSDPSDNKKPFRPAFWKLPHLTGLPGTTDSCFPKAKDDNDDPAPPAKKPRIEGPASPSTSTAVGAETQTTGAKPDTPGDAVATTAPAEPEETFEWNDEKVTKEEHETHMKEAVVAREYYTKLLAIAQDRLWELVGQIDDVKEINKTIRPDHHWTIIGPMVFDIVNRVGSVAVDMYNPSGGGLFQPRRDNMVDKATQTAMDNKATQTDIGDKATQTNMDDMATLVDMDDKATQTDICEKATQTDMHKKATQAHMGDQATQANIPEAHIYTDKEAQTVMDDTARAIWRLRPIWNKL